MEPSRNGNYSPVQVVNFFLFNTAWGTKEGEEEKKLVYFWPEDAETDTKLRKLGLVEGVVNFALRFSAGQHPPHSLHTLKQRLCFLEVEKDYWLCIAVAVPNTRKQQQQQNKGNDTTSGDNSSGTGDVIEFYPEDVGDEVLLSLLKRAYAMFSLFHSGLAASLVGRCGGNIKLFMDLAQHFFSRYLGTLRVDRSDLTYIWGGIQYLAVEMVDFLRVQSIVNKIKADQDNISKCLFLQSGQLIWSDVDPELTKLLVQYLSTTILASLNTLQRNNAVLNRKPCGSFLVGDEAQLPTVFLNNRSYHLAVYHVVNTTLVLLLNANPNQQFYTRFKDNPGKELGNLSADLTHTYISKQASSSSSGGSRSDESNTSSGTPSAALSPPPSSSDSVMFLYFNASNLAVKSTVGEGHSKAIMLAQDMIQDLRLTIAPDGVGLSADGGQVGEGEVVSRLSTDEWVVVQVAGSRTIVVVLTDKNINLMDVAESVSRLKKTSFDNICML